MTDEEFEAYQAQKMSKEGLQPTSPSKSALRGAGSGLLSGFQPQVAGALEAITPAALGGTSYNEGVREAQFLNEKAFRDNPASYGAGYAGGTGAQFLAAAPLAAAGRAAALSRAGMATADKLNKAKSVMKGDEMSGAVFDKLRNVGNTPAVQATSNVLTSTPVTQTATRAAGAITNQPNFGEMQQYLSEEEKRRAVMRQQATPDGRAQTNTESPVKPFDIPMM